MNIKTEEDITGAVALELRTNANLSQVKFWKSVGSYACAGYLFENDKRRNGIPRPVRKLIFLKYVAGIPIDASTPEGAAQVVKYAKLLNATIEAGKAQAVAEAAKAQVDKLSA